MLLSRNWLNEFVDVSEVNDHDFSEDMTLSGAALMSGVMLKPLFRGTGYDENQRTQGDFGSDLYIIQPKE